MTRVEPVVQETKEMLVNLAARVDLDTREEPTKQKTTKVGQTELGITMAV